MSELLEQAIASHGGREQWCSVAGLHARVASGGLLFTSKWQCGALRGVEALVDTWRPRTVLTPYPRPRGRGVFEPDRVWIESDEGHVLDERREPRARFGTVRRSIWWDKLDVLYFAGYALWNYLCAPFVFTLPGFGTEEIAPWEEGGERWRRLRVVFPPDVPTHCREQIFYFDARGLLRRLDYTAEVVGSWARAAHYCLDHRTFSGLVFPTRRIVVPRRRDGRARRGPTLVWIELGNVTTVRRG